jgi:hypothetical protein
MTKIQNDEEGMKKIILGIQITDRLTKAPEAQKIFSKYGCNIKDPPRPA